MSTLQNQRRDEIRNLFLQTGSIRGVAAALGISRNTIRSTLRSEGLSSATLPLQVTPSSPAEPVESSAVAKTVLQGLDFAMLEKMFTSIHEPNASKDFEKHIKSMAIEIGSEIGVTGRLDTVRLEVAVSQYILYRRFYFRSLDASDKQYCGPFMKAHEKVARATVSWVDASTKAFDQFNRLLRELEIKYHKRSPELRQPRILVQQQVNVRNER